MSCGGVITRHARSDVLHASVAAHGDRAGNRQLSFIATTRLVVGLLALALGVREQQCVLKLLLDHGVDGLEELLAYLRHVGEAGSIGAREALCRLRVLSA